MMASTTSGRNAAKRLATKSSEWLYPLFLGLAPAPTRQSTGLALELELALELAPSMGLALSIGLALRPQLKAFTSSSSSPGKVVNTDRSEVVGQQCRHVVRNGVRNGVRGGVPEEPLDDALKAAPCARNGLSSQESGPSLANAPSAEPMASDSSLKLLMLLQSSEYVAPEMSSKKHSTSGEASVLAPSRSRWARQSPSAPGSATAQGRPSGKYAAKPSPFAAPPPGEAREPTPGVSKLSLRVAMGTTTPPALPCANMKEKRQNHLSARTICERRCASQA